LQSQDKMMKLFKSQKGFTLIELLVVIGILAVLLAITLIAINPARQFAQANNTQRSSDVNTILNAINQYMADNKGNLPTALEAATCTIDAPCSLAEDDNPVTTSDVNLCAEVVSNYLAALPGDPKDGVNTPLNETTCGTAGITYDTHYEIYKGNNNRITVTAPGAEQIGAATPIIAVTR
jgi:prepilin-type N-terminal cleavage/methylation domain-containing protein